jgi:hypothetical protein
MQPYFSSSATHELDNLNFTLHLRVPKIVIVAVQKMEDLGAALLLV